LENALDCGNGKKHCRNRIDALKAAMQLPDFAVMGLSSISEVSVWR
jgi:hypothetical protein